MKPQIPTMASHGQEQYITRGGVITDRTAQPLPYNDATEHLIVSLDQHKGVLLGSNYEYPGRYTRWEMGFDKPPIQITSRGDDCLIQAENERGTVLLDTLQIALQDHPAIAASTREDRVIRIDIAKPSGFFPEEMRSRQPSIFSLLRTIIDFFAPTSAAIDSHLGLYGAFGYNLAYRFEPIRRRPEYDAKQRELVLYIPDRLILVDHYTRTALRYSYEFSFADRTTLGLARSGQAVPYQPADGVPSPCDHGPGEYAATVRRAIEAFRAGDLFEVVPGQVFRDIASVEPAELYRRIYRRNPAPYSFFINLGEQEYLVGASPEMYVRVEGRRVETAPISGTIKRVGDPIGDSRQVFQLLASAKEEAELTMCTDVDRNDKSRICEPGSVQVIGRRQIEIYSRLIHTVDHVEGTLRDQYDAIDAFLSHSWAVTVTGAPKKRAMQFIEDNEKSERDWYGGAIGCLGFDGNMNTGLTLRTLHVKNGVTSVRAGATLLVDSDPDAEERETRLKAEAFLAAMRDDVPGPVAMVGSLAPVGAGRRILLVDHDDSFIHTLGNYFRQTSAEVTTWRFGFDEAALDAERFDLVVLSPGPGKPSDFAMSSFIASVLARSIPIFGICLGMQAIAEHFGATLRVMDPPMHGKPSLVRQTDLATPIFTALPPQFTVGRYHSLIVERATCPDILRITAETGESAAGGVVMALDHMDLPVAGVQFHPESILTLDEDVGRRMIFNVVNTMIRERETDNAG